jgi:hypothetical protein
MARVPSSLSRAPRSSRATPSSVEVYCGVGLRGRRSSTAAFSDSSVAGRRWVPEQPGRIERDPIHPLGARAHPEQPRDLAAAAAYPMKPRKLLDALADRARREQPLAMGPAGARLVPLLEVHEEMPLRNVEQDAFHVDSGWPGGTSWPGSRFRSGALRRLQGHGVEPGRGRLHEERRSRPGPHWLPFRTGELRTAANTCAVDASAHRAPPRPKPALRARARS